MSRPALAEAKGGIYGEHATVMCEGTCARAIRTELEYKAMISV
jgi:hypothetical protein